MLEKYRQPLLKALAEWHEKYDPEAEMIKMPFSSPGYHTTLKGGFVHPTRESLIYALALFDQGEVELAERIIRKVLSLQDTDPRHTYGLWFAEGHFGGWHRRTGAGQTSAARAFGDSGLRGSWQRISETIKAHFTLSIHYQEDVLEYTNISLIGAFDWRQGFWGRGIAMERT